MKPPWIASRMGNRQLISTTDVVGWRDDRPPSEEGERSTSRNSLLIKRKLEASEWVASYHSWTGAHAAKLHHTLEADSSVYESRKEPRSPAKEVMARGV